MRRKDRPAFTGQVPVTDKLLTTLDRLATRHETRVHDDDGLHRDTARALRLAAAAIHGVDERVAARRHPMFGGLSKYDHGVNAGLDAVMHALANAVHDVEEGYTDRFTKAPAVVSEPDPAAFRA